ISSGAINLTSSSTSAINIGTPAGYNGLITIGNADTGDGDQPEVAITTTGWTMGITGAFANSAGATVTSSGLITANSGITTNTGAVNLLPTGTVAVNIGTPAGYNGAITIGNTDGGDGGTPTIIVTSPGWTIDTAGNASGFGTIGADGLITGTAGLTISSGAINLTSSSTSAINIGTPAGYNGLITIGNADTGDGDQPEVAITTTGWSMGITGTFTNTSGATVNSSGRITSTGGLTVSGGTVVLNDNTNAAVSVCTLGGCNGAITIGNTDGGDGGTPTVIITSPGWTIDTAGNASGFGTIGADGLITGTAGLTISSGAINLTSSSTSAINIGTPAGYNGLITIGNTDGGDGFTPTVTITSSGWTIDTAGNASGFGSITSDGAISTSSTFNANGLVSVGLGTTASTTAVCSSLASATSPTGGTAYQLRDCSGAPIADYAEQYPVDQDVVYGDIVTASEIMITTKDGDKVPRLLKSGSAYQNTLVGVVSNNYGDFTSAGYNLNDSDHPMPVALNGRVLVRVTKENGAIKIGDPITSSSKPGVGMKATQNGMIIGFALNAFDQNEDGRIMVFINLGWWNGSEVADMNASSGAGSVSTLTAQGDLDMAGRDIINVRILKGLNDAWQIDESGKLIIREVVAEKVTSQEYAIKNQGAEKTVGRETVTAGATGKLVLNPKIAADSLIVVTFEGNPGSAWWIEEKQAGSFMVKFAGTAPQDINFVYWIVGVDGQLAPPAAVEPPAPASEPTTEPINDPVPEPATETTPEPSPAAPSEASEPAPQPEPETSPSNPSAPDALPPEAPSETS
ncbi:procyclic acidic repetitive family protein, partial [Candidatus Uhrbacteria bacterium]|nr:procyclic acidic repetitive family protein [Candidatus Uhrbacteria bacterium]